MASHLPIAGLPFGEQGVVAATPQTHSVRAVIPAAGERLGVVVELCGETGAARRDAERLWKLVPERVDLVVA